MALLKPLSTIECCDGSRGVSLNYAPPSPPHDTERVSSRKALRQVLFLLVSGTCMRGPCLLSICPAAKPVAFLFNLFVPTVPTFAVRETASLGIMGAPRVPPLNPSESIVLKDEMMYEQVSIDKKKII